MENAQIAFQEEAPIQATEAEVVPEVVVEEAHPEEEHERKNKRIHRDTGKTRINQLQREKYMAMEERDRIASEYQRLHEENERLRQISDNTTQAALSQYEISAHDKLKSAREKKMQALENGDIKAQVEADEIMAAATAELVQLQYSKSQMDIQRKQEEEAYNAQLQEQARIQEAYQNASPLQINRDVAEAWVQDNPWFNPKSPEYDQELAHYVGDITDQYDAELIRRGQKDYILSPGYFQELDQVINRVVNQRQQQYSTDYDRRPAMNDVRTPVSPVRSGYNPGARSAPRKVTLTNDEMTMARRLGVSPEIYARQKEIDRINQKNKGQGRNY